MLTVLIEFLIFVFLQGLLINGVKECFSGKCWQDMTKGRICAGNIFYKINPEWFERNKDKIWAQPIFGCVKCMASFYGTLSFWPVAILVYGFHWEEIFVWIADMFILVTVNWLIYKKL